MQFAGCGLGRTKRPRSVSKLLATEGALLSSGARPRRSHLTIRRQAAAGCDGRRKDGVEVFRPLAVGEAAPAYEAITLTGDSVHLGGAGPVTLLNVWATWCTSCREEMQDLETMQRDFGTRGLRILAVSLDKGDGTRVQRYAESQHLTFPIAHDPDGIVQQRYSTVGVPESYLIGRNGTLLWRQTGGLHGNTAAARDAVERAIQR